MRQLLKRAALLVLAAGLLLGSAPGLLVTEAEAAGTFSDVSDLTMAQNIEVLQLMGVVDGVSATSFDPSGTLTRAQFCKMAVEAMGQGDRVNIYQNYTIFPDVKPGHWAAGYINLASRLSADGTEGGDEGKSTRLISGFSDGTFGPERTVTYGQAITILMRMLGYGDSDVSVVWPDGYIDQAMAIGLSDGVKLSGGSPINRGQAVRLFVNLLNCEQKGGSKFYNKLGTATATVLIDANGKNAAGQPVLRTNGGGEYLIAGKPGAGLLAGSQGVVVVDGEIAKAFVPTSKGSSRSVTIAKAETLSLTDSSGVKYTVSKDAKLLRGGEDLPYANHFTTLRAGTMATLYISAGGLVESVFVSSTTSDDAVIIAKDGSTAGFALLTDRTDYKIFKHGEIVNPKALREYDVATYSSSNNTVYVSDNRITVYYQDASPNATAPTSIKVTGVAEELEVLPCAIDSIAKCQVGKTITLMLTENNKVAGATMDNMARSNALGFVDENGSLELFNGLKITGVAGLDQLHGQLVTVSSSNASAPSARRLSGKSVSGDLNVSRRTVGTVEVAPDARLYETVNGSELREISWDDIVSDEIKNAGIAYTHKNYAGKVDILVVEDVTGEGYKYGRVFVSSVNKDSDVAIKDANGVEPGKEGWTPTYRTETTTTTTTKVCRSRDGKEITLMESTILRGHTTGQWMGISTKAENGLVSGRILLEAVENVPADAWRDNNGSVYVGGELYTVSKNIDGGCYNRDSDVWFRNLNAALAYGGKVTLFVDEGNVVRGVEVGR